MRRTLDGNQRGSVRLGEHKHILNVPSLNPGSSIISLFLISQNINRHQEYVAYKFVLNAGDFGVSELKATLGFERRTGCRQDNKLCQQVHMCQFLQNASEITYLEINIRHQSVIVSTAIKNKLQTVVLCRSRTTTFSPLRMQCAFKTFMDSYVSALGMERGINSCTNKVYISEKKCEVLKDVQSQLTRKYSLT